MKFHIYCNIMRIYLSVRPSVRSRAGRHLKWPGNFSSSLLRQFAPDSIPFPHLLDPFEHRSDSVTLFCKSLSSGQARQGSWFLVSNIPRNRIQSENSFFSRVDDCRNISPSGGGGASGDNEQTGGRTSISSLSSSSRNKIGALPDWNNQFDLKWSWRGRFTCRSF